jgi:cytochrome d ubiquinol oxidase subunit II
MILDYETLKLVWWLFVGVLLIGFAITDGFDMGAGVLLPWGGRNDEERRVIINAVAPHWDGNQVWLITAGGAIFAAWPATYAAAFSGFYVAMMLVLFSLFFRPVGFDYRSKIENPTWRNLWDWGLFAGGFVPALVFGVAFGNLLQGVPFQYDDFLRPWYTGSFFQLLNPFALLTGVVSLSLLTLHGAVYLHTRTTGAVKERMEKAVMIFGALLIVSFAGAGIWIASGFDGYEIVSMPATDTLPNPTAKTVEIAAGAWMQNYQKFPAAIAAPVLGFLGIAGAVFFTARNRGGLAFISSSLAIIGVIMTAGVSMFPFIMPSSTVPSHSLTLWDASSSHLTLTVMFWATMIFLPIVIGYTLWCYKSLWSKVTIEEIRAKSHELY